MKKNESELQKNGYEVLRGNRLKIFALEFRQTFVEEINFLHTRNVGIFNFRAFINLAMLLSRSPVAREVRSLVLDIVIDTINKRTGGKTKSLNFSQFVKYLKAFKATAKDTLTEEQFNALDQAARDASGWIDGDM